MRKHFMAAIVAAALALLMSGCGHNQESDGSSSSNLISSDPACKSPAIGLDKLKEITRTSNGFRLFTCVATPDPSILWSYTPDVGNDNTPPYVTIQRWTGQTAINKRQALQSTGTGPIPDAGKGYDFGDSDWLWFCVGCNDAGTAQLYNVMWHNSDPAGNDNSGTGKLIAQWLVENSKS